MSELNEFDDSEALTLPVLDDETQGPDLGDADVEPTEAPVPEGTVLVAMRRGHKFVLPQQEGEPLVIEQEPVEVPEGLLKQLIKASNGRLFVVPGTKEG